MSSSVVFLFVLSIVVVVFSEEQDKPHRRAHPKNPAKIVFPACKSFVEAMEKSGDELHKADQIGHRACSDENRENCFKTDAMKVRCSATATPSEECIAEITAYLQGETCNQ